LFKRGREEEAIEVLCAVFDLPRDDPYIVSEVRAIKHALSVEAGVRSHRALFKSDKLKTRRRIVLAYFGLFMNQMVGINLVVYYAPSKLAFVSNMQRLTGVGLLVQSINMEPRTAQVVAGLWVDPLPLIFIY
jgi:acyl-CoA synthetase (AMP-forming)/AMP-acid ligase II